MRLPFRSEASYRREDFAGILIIIGSIILAEYFFNLSYFIGLLFRDPDDFDISLFKICLSLLIIGFMIMFTIPSLRNRKAKEKTGSLYLMTYGEKIQVDLTECHVKEIFETEIPQFALVFQNFKSEVLTISKEELEEKLLKQKLTFIYVDKRDRTKYCFDVDFLLD